MTYSAVLFDLDGTLLDTIEDIGDAVNRVLTERGFPTHPMESYRYFVGSGAETLIKRALPASERNGQSIEACIRAFLKAYDLTWKVKTRPYDGITPLLDELRKRGLPLGILSNKDHAFTVKCTEEYFGQGTFQVILGHRAEVPPKPDPAGAFDAAARLGLEPARILYLGDTAIDMKTAVLAGMFPVGALWGFRTREELLGGGARVVVRHPLDVLTLLQ